MLVALRFVAPVAAASLLVACATRPQGGGHGDATGGSGSGATLAVEVGGGAACCKYQPRAFIQAPNSSCWTYWHARLNAVAAPIWRDLEQLKKTGDCSYYEKAVAGQRRWDAMSKMVLNTCADMHMNTRCGESCYRRQWKVFCRSKPVSPHVHRTANALQKTKKTSQKTRSSGSTVPSTSAALNPASTPSSNSGGLDFLGRGTFRSRQHLIDDDVLSTFGVQLGDLQFRQGYLSGSWGNATAINEVGPGPCSGGTPSSSGIPRTNGTTACFAYNAAHVLLPVDCSTPGAQTLVPAPAASSSPTPAATVPDPGVFSGIGNPIVGAPSPQPGTASSPAPSPAQVQATNPSSGGPNTGTPAAVANHPGSPSPGDVDPVDERKINDVLNDPHACPARIWPPFDSNARCNPNSQYSWNCDQNYELGSSAQLACMEKINSCYARDNELDKKRIAYNQRYYDCHRKADD